MSFSQQWKKFLTAGCISGVAVGCFWIGESGLLSQTVEAQLHANPFHLERSIATADAQGKMVVIRTEIVARRSDGTTAHLQSVGPVGARQYLRKVIHPDGTIGTFVDSVKAKVTWPKLTPDEAARYRSRLAISQQDCPVGSEYSVLGFDVYRGVKVVILRRSSAGQYRLTRWLAPTLGCEDLYYKSEKVNSDGTYSTSAEATISELTLGEPDSRLFDKGQGFSEMEPSQAHKLLMDADGPNGISTEWYRRLPCCA